MVDVHHLNCEYHKMSDDSFIDTAANTPEKDSNSVSAFFYTRFFKTGSSQASSTISF